jgi:hypothetical protein
MTITNRITASPATLEERTNIPNDPISVARAHWFIAHFQNGLERQLHLAFDPSLTGHDRIVFKRKGNQLNAESIVAWLEHAGLKFRPARMSVGIPYAMISDRQSIDGQYIYFSVTYYATQGTVTVSCQW